MAGLDGPVDESIHGDTIIVRVDHVIGAIALERCSAERRDRFGGEVHRQTIVMRPHWPRRVERTRRQPGQNDAEQPAREHVRNIDLSLIAAVRQDHVGAEHRHRQIEALVRLPQQYLTRPLAMGVAVCIALAVEPPHGRGCAHVRILVDGAALGEHGCGDRRDIDEGLAVVRQRKPDQLRSADHIGSEQLLIGQHVVDEGGWVHDQIDRLRKPPPITRIEAQMRLTEIGVEDLEVIGGQALEVLLERRITAVECGRNTSLGGG